MTIQVFHNKRERDDELRLNLPDATRPRLDEPAAEQVHLASPVVEGVRKIVSKRPLSPDLETSSNHSKWFIGSPEEEEFSETFVDPKKCPHRYAIESDEGPKAYKIADWTSVRNELEAIFLDSEEEASSPGPRSRELSGSSPVSPQVSSDEEEYRVREMSAHEIKAAIAALNGDYFFRS